MPDHSDKPLDDLTVDFPTRPKMPPLAGVTDDHRRKGRHLAAIHRSHLWQLARIDRVLKRIEAGDSPPDDLADIVLAMDMTRNFKSFGTLCGQECRVLTFHHDAEEHMLFPQLDSVGHNALSALIARLKQEHEIVHELLHRLQLAATALMREPSETQFQDVSAIFRQLTKVVQSHFGYEESELEEAIGLHGPDF